MHGITEQRMKLNNLTTLLFSCIMMVSVEATFDFTVRFYDYWNPTGLCAECGTSGVPVCCDDPQRTESCQNTGVFRCDTRFRFIQRPFNAPQEKAPSGGFPYFTQGITNKNHDTFPEGRYGFLTLPNPHTSTNSQSAWTGKVQLLVDALDRINPSQAPNETEGIIDRFLINIEQLQLGADLNEKTTYTGIYGMSQLSMSFRVECSENYYGSDCTTFCEAVEGVYTCDSDGNIVCVEQNRDPSTNCSQCVPGRNTSTYNCASCLPGYTGDNCVMDPCLSSPCENGATCTPDDTTGGYQCECAVGYEGTNCATEIQESQPVSATLIGGVVAFGGVAGVLLSTLLVLVVVVLCMTFQLKKQRHGELDFSEPTDNVNEQQGENSPTKQTPDDDIELKQNIVYGVNSTKTRKIELEMNQAYGDTSGERLHQEEGTYYANEGMGPDSMGDQTDEYDYI